MKAQDGGEGLAEVFVKGVVFTLGAAAVGLVLRRFGQERREIVLVMAEEADPHDLEHSDPHDLGDPDPQAAEREP